MNVFFWNNRDLPPSSHEVRFQAIANPASMTDLLVKVSGCRPAEAERLGVGRRTETAHARTRRVSTPDREVTISHR